MSDEKKQPGKSSKPTKQQKKLHVDTLHIHANEIVFHQNDQEGGAGAATTPPQQQQQPQIARDFWGFPIRQPQPQEDAPSNEAAAEKSEEAEDKEEKKEDNEGEGTPNQGEQQGPPPGWI